MRRGFQVVWAAVILVALGSVMPAFANPPPQAQVAQHLQPEPGTHQHGLVDVSYKAAGGYGDGQRCHGDKANCNRPSNDDGRLPANVGRVKREGELSREGEEGGFRHPRFDWIVPRNKFLRHHRVKLSPVTRRFPYSQYFKDDEETEVLEGRGRGVSDGVGAGDVRYEPAANYRYRDSASRTSYDPQEYRMNDQAPRNDYSSSEYYRKDRYSGSSTYDARYRTTDDETRPRAPSEREPKRNYYHFSRSENYQPPDSYRSSNSNFQRRYDYRQPQYNRDRTNNVTSNVTFPFQVYNRNRLYMQRNFTYKANYSKLRTDYYNAERNYSIFRRDRGGYRPAADYSRYSRGGYDSRREPDYYPRRTYNDDRYYYNNYRDYDNAPDVYRRRSYDEYYRKDYGGRYEGPGYDRYRGRYPYREVGRYQPQVPPRLSYREGSNNYPRKSYGYGDRPDFLRYRNYYDTADDDGDYAEERSGRTKAYMPRYNASDVFVPSPSKANLTAHRFIIETSEKRLPEKSLYLNEGTEAGEKEDIALTSNQPGYYKLKLKDDFFNNYEDRIEKSDVPMTPKSTGPHGKLFKTFTPKKSLRIRKYTPRPTFAPRLPTRIVKNSSGEYTVIINERNATNIDSVYPFLTSEYRKPQPGSNGKASKKSEYASLVSEFKISPAKDAGSESSSRKSQSKSSHEASSAAGSSGEKTTKINKNRKKINKTKEIDKKGPVKLRRTRKRYTRRKRMTQRKGLKKERNDSKKEKNDSKKEKNDSKKEKGISKTIESDSKEEKNDSKYEKKSKKDKKRHKRSLILDNIKYPFPYLNNFLKKRNLVSNDLLYSLHFKNRKRRMVEESNGSGSKVGVGRSKSGSRNDWENRKQHEKRPILTSSISQNERPPLVGKVEKLSEKSTKRREKSKGKKMSIQNIIEEEMKPKNLYEFTVKGKRRKNREEESEKGKKNEKERTKTPLRNTRVPFQKKSRTFSKFWYVGEQMLENNLQDLLRYDFDNIVVPTPNFNYVWEFDGVQNKFVTSRYDGRAVPRNQSMFTARRRYVGGIFTIRYRGYRANISSLEMGPELDSEGRPHPTPKFEYWYTFPDNKNYYPKHLYNSSELNKSLFQTFFKDETDVDLDRCANLTLSTLDVEEATTNYTGNGTFTTEDPVNLRLRPSQEEWLDDYYIRREKVSAERKKWLVERANRTGIRIQERSDEYWARAVTYPPWVEQYLKESAKNGTTTQRMMISPFLPID